MSRMLILMLLLVSCSQNSSKQINLDSVLYNSNDSVRYNLIDTAKLNKANTTYLHTGFYFLSVEKNGVRKQIEKSNEFYTIAPKPFASVDDIIKTKLEKTKLKNGEIYTELCLTFNAKGAKDIQEGTGNYLHPKIAVVIANKLLYVVESNATITTGIMCIGLYDYSDKEINVLQKEVDRKE